MADRYGYDDSQFDQAEQTAQQLLNAEKAAAQARSEEKNTQESSDDFGQKARDADTQPDFAPRFRRSTDSKDTKKSKKGIYGIIGAFVGVGGIGAGSIFLMFTGMLPGITSASTYNLDSSSPALERRLSRVFQNMMTSDSDAICKGAKKLKCKMGRVSNKTLHSLAKKGIVADGYDGKTKKGFPDKKPTSYEYTDKAGKTQKIAANDLPSFLNQPENRFLAARVMGVGGAFNMKVRAWRGKHIDNRLYKVFGIDRSAKFLREKIKGSNISERVKNVSKRYSDEMKKLESKNSIDGKIKNKVGDMSDKGKKGGVAYMTLMAGCIASKAPTIIASTTAAMQLAQLTPLFAELVLAPSDYQKGSGIIPDQEVTPDQVETIGSLLTDRSENDKGEKKSALDSPYLLAAMGVNNSRIKVNKELTPGYGVIQNDFFKSSKDFQSYVTPGCDVILNPVTMYSFAAAESAVSLIAAPGIGTVVKLGASWAISEIVTKVGTKVVAHYAKKIIGSIALKDMSKIIKPGEQLGDALGISALSFYSAGGVARHLPTLSTSQLGDAEAVKTAALQNRAKLAALNVSPFDITSEYSFLGSLATNLRTFAFTNHMYSSSILDNAATVMSLPLSMFKGIPLMSSAHAVNQNIKNCSYAGDFGYDTSGKDVRLDSIPAVNVAGTPCTGITSDTANITSESAIDILIKNDQIDGTKDIPEGATIDELVGKGKPIKEDSLLGLYIKECGDLSTGDYLFNQATCTVPSKTSAVAHSVTLAADEECSVDGGGSVEDCFDDKNSAFDKDGYSSEVYHAMSAFVLDYQIVQSITGEDEEEAGGGADTVSDDDVGGGTVDGDVPELAKKLLDLAKKGKLHFWNQARDVGDKSRPIDNLEQLSQGKKANTSTRCGFNTGGSVAVEANLLKFLVDLTESTGNLTINSLVGQCHSKTSNHYKGQAVDLGCKPRDHTSIGDKIGKKYGVKRFASENCPAHHHLHYSTTGN